MCQFANQHSKYRILYFLHLIFVTFYSLPETIKMEITIFLAALDTEVSARSGSQFSFWLMFTTMATQDIITERLRQSLNPQSPMYRPIVQVQCYCTCILIQPNTICTCTLDHCRLEQYYWWRYYMGNLPLIYWGKFNLQCDLCTPLLRKGHHSPPTA